MKLLLIHLSDIHIKNELNPIQSRLELLVRSFKDEAMSVDYIYIVITGDIAYSGLGKEYYIAISLIEEIKSLINVYIKKNAIVIMVPGNHDCDFSCENQVVRDALISQIRQNNDIANNNAVVRQCCTVQKSYFEFMDLYLDESAAVQKSELLWIIEFALKSNYKVVFNCYNSSWLSQLKEQYGLLLFPKTCRPDTYFANDADINISVLHHPINWYNPNNYREFRKHIESTSDIIMTGHEHLHDKRMVKDIDGGYVEYIEGAILQDSSNCNASSFNIIVIDLCNNTRKLITYSWENDKYISADSSEWISFAVEKLRKKNKIEINEKYRKFLSEPGAIFMHKQKKELTLDDIFIYPDLRDIKIESAKEKDILNDILCSDSLIDNDAKKNRILLIGAEQSGKTALCKTFYKHYYNNEYIPIYIDGRRIKHFTLDEFNKLLYVCFEEQYSGDYAELFKQLDNERKLIMIDNIDNSKLNINYRHKLIHTLNEYYPNIIITGNELYKLEEMTQEDIDVGSTYEEYGQYEIIEFGHLKRSQLIERWHSLGIEPYIDESDLAHASENTQKVINTIIGKNFVPSYPFFLLTILQSIELGTPHNLKESSYGYYYDLLITQALGRINIKNDEIDAHNNYLIELAYFYFDSKYYEITKSQLERYHSWFCQEYDVNPQFDKYIDGLLKSSILEENHGVYKFKYRYVYYYFVAKYYSNNISREEMREQIKEMCKRVHKEEFANIIMFLTHMSKDPYILNNILENSKKIFNDMEPIKFDKDVSSINSLIKNIPRLVLEDADVKKNRENKLKHLDEAEIASKNHNEVEDYDINEDVSNLDIISQLNLSFKTIEIIGQLLKNYYGSLKGPIKYELCFEAYCIGLRTLNKFCSIFEKNSDYLVRDIKIELDKHKIVDKDKVEDYAREVLFQLCLIVSYLLIKKISNSIGSEKLSVTFNHILDDNDIPAMHLIDTSIKLDFFRGFPFDVIKRLSQKLEGNIMPMTMLKKMVLDYLYMYPTSYKDKQRICDALNIPISTQRRIDNTSTQKKLVR